MNLKKLLALGLSLTMAATLVAGCGSNTNAGDTSGDQTADKTSSDKSAQQVIIYSNADEEAVTAMENALDAGGYEGKYIVQTYGLVYTTPARTPFSLQLTASLFRSFIGR